MPWRCSTSIARTGAADVPPFAFRVLRLRPQERQVLVQHVLDPEEHVPKSGAPHRRRQSSPADAIAGHPLDDVVDVVEAGGDDGIAQRLEPRDVQRDVVVDDEDRARAARLASRMSSITRSIGHTWKLRPRISMIEQKLQS